MLWYSGRSGLKGPAAAAPYGADASAGVIQVLTKRGQIGTDRYMQNISVEYNALDQTFTPPANFAACGEDDVVADSPTALCRGQTVGTIISDNPLERTGAFQTGYLRSIGYSGRGGGDNYGYYLSVGWDYGGRDPEVLAQATRNTGVDTFEREDFLTVPQPAAGSPSSTLASEEPDEADNDTIKLAAYVGKARAHLFLGEHDQAVQAAAQVPADFNFTVPKVDDPSFRGRLGNTVWSFTLARSSLVVPPYYQGLEDPRIEFRLWLNDEDEPIKSQGNNFDFFGQEKYPGWAASLRLASGLEARYIAAEAELALGNAAPALALIAERTEAESKDGDDVDFLDDTGTLVQLLDQKARDFWLEGTHLGDWRRNPSSTPYVAPAGSPYYASDVGGNFGNVTCFPVPQDEVDNNPNF